VLGAHPARLAAGAEHDRLGHLRPLPRRHRLGRHRRGRRRGRLVGRGHRAFLSDFYSGQFPGSFARGAVFQYNPATGDRRISGSCASLAGLEAALDASDERAIGLAIERILWAHALACGFGGIPLLYMGDELGMLNDHRYLRRPRPPMDWTAADRRHLPGTIEARVYHGLLAILRARGRTPHLHAQTPAEVLDTRARAGLRPAAPPPARPLAAVYNVSDEPQELDAGGSSTSACASPTTNSSSASSTPVAGAERCARTTGCGSCESGRPVVRFAGRRSPGAPMAPRRREPHGRGLRRRRRVC
jgi:hypothetical protein